MSMLDHALALARRGWPVFPCDPQQDPPEAKVRRSKRPLVPGPDKDIEGNDIARTGGLWRASTDETQIRAWWRTRPRALIGVPMGQRSGVFVIDLDPVAKDGSVEPVESILARLVAAVGDLPAGPVSETQSGGRHIWFRMPDSGEIPKNSAKRLPRIDWRGDGGYVIAPPSVMSDGAAYRWIVSPDEVGFPEPPARLLDLVFQRGEFDRETRPSGDADHFRGPTKMIGLASVGAPRGDDPGDRAVRAYARAALDRAARDVAGAARGTRGHTLNAAAYGIAPFIAAGAISDREAIAALQDAADSCGLTATDGAPERDAKIRRGIEAGKAGGADQRGTLDRIRGEAHERAARRGSRTPGRASPGDYGLPDDRAPRGMSADEAFQHGDGQDRGPDDLPGWPDAGPQPDVGTGEGIDPAVVASCALLDHSDTDNAERLIRHFGDDLTVLAQEGVAEGDWLVWAGTHWDIAGGAARARLIAQKLGGRIALEADVLAATPAEQAALDAGADAKAGLDALTARRADWGDEDKRRAAQLALVVAAGEEARDALKARKKARRNHAVTSKNHARMEKALSCAASRLRRPPEAFNARRLTFATPGHTITFRRELDDECPDPEARRITARLDVLDGHRRENWITACVPLRWEGLDAKAPRFERFLEEMMPDAAKRRTLQQFSGLGLTAVPVQYVMFHYGLGANGKSVFLETLTRALGTGLAVGLPRESIVGGGERGQGAASPDVVRLYGKRMVRIAELKANAELQEDFIKRLTGGEAFPARSLFKGYFEFQSVAKPHMSGNGFPRIDGTDNGIWRRMLVVHWDQTIAEDRRRDLEEMVREFIEEEGPGVLAWLVRGVMDWLENGMFIAESVKQTTADYREEMDPISQFSGACVRAREGSRVQASTMFAAYESWSLACAKRPKSNTMFGRVLGQHWKKTEIGGRIYYDDCELHDVPDRPDQRPETRDMTELRG
jgi:putative DNA primase/helicase